MSGKIKRFNAKELAAVTKDIRQGLKIPMETFKKIQDELLDKYDIKGFQTLYDYLIVSGVVYLKKDILEVVEARIPEYTARYKQAKMARLGKADRPDRGEIKQLVCMMYDRDLLALNNFLVEKQVKKFWVIDILMDEFAKENPVIIEHVKSCQKLNVTQRKKQLARLLNDEYITVLPEREATAILDQLTDRYDKRQFGGFIQEAIENLQQRLTQKKEEEEDVESELNAKLARLRKGRMREVEAITEPLIDDDT